jgi:hypothetical protein
LEALTHALIKKMRERFSVSRPAVHMAL